ncbi:ribokinase [Thermoanaerobacterium sp. CMT5567-10]|uniref:ribokinase n=1 Tax=Thermoanaerobacterium sp. CMT5567-10 TaxID=3061989 RepID=UPI0026DF02DC|nr:ribokinase [Thermoanaerobacterium sp. CMT5567-10]WKV10098.1 ribokinase [Thermoanaerobacterium sp. CMT5567-10]
MNNILVVGSINMDIVARVEHIPQIGETVIAREVKYFYGGKGANQAVSIAKLKGNVIMIGRVGNDGYGKDIIENLKKHNVKIDGIEVDNQKKTGTAFIYVSDKGENNIVVNQGANKNLDVEQIKRHVSLFENVKFCILQLEIPIETIKYVVEICNKRNIKIILNPAPAREIPEAILNKIYILTPNKTELSILTNKIIKTQEDVDNASIMLIDKGVENVITTLGDEGCYFKNRFESCYFPAIKVKPVDTTGAGDSFNGALSAALCDDINIKKAIEFATYVSALTVTKEGAQSSFPDKIEVNKFINDRRNYDEKNKIAE